MKLPPTLEKEIAPDEQEILVDESVEPALGVAQAVSHLDLGHHDHPDGRLSADEHAAALWLAQVRLDAEKSRQADDEGEAESSATERDNGEQ